VNELDADLSNGVDDVVDFEDGPDRLRGKVDGRGGDEEGLDDVLVEDVGDAALAHVDTGHGLSLRVAVAELGHSRDRVEAGVLCQGVGDDLEGLGKGLEAVGVCANQGVGMIGKLKVQLRL
jgi:hypothetical protein